VKQGGDWQFAAPRWWGGIFDGVNSSSETRSLEAPDPTSMVLLELVIAVMVRHLRVIQTGLAAVRR